jgi:hypothetical protein
MRIVPLVSLHILTRKRLSVLLALLAQGQQIRTSVINIGRGELGPVQSKLKVVASHGLALASGSVLLAPLVLLRCYPLSSPVRSFVLYSPSKSKLVAVEDGVYSSVQRTADVSVLSLE